MVVFNSLSVIVWMTPDKSEEGILKFNYGNSFVDLKSGRIISGKNLEGVYADINQMISQDYNGVSSIVPTEECLRFFLKPELVVKHPYAQTGGQFIEDVFPPSTSGFYAKLQEGKDNALYFIHKTVDGTRFLLFITDLSSDRIFETQIIKPFEAEALSLRDDMKILEEVYYKSVAAKRKSKDEILNILDTPSVSWKNLSKILENVSIPNLSLGNTMRDTLSQIVPDSFPYEVKEELMAFLAYIVKSRIPNEDPITYSLRFSSTPIIENLLNGHLMHLIDRTDWPPYVKLMTLAARNQLGPPKRAVSDSIMSSPWLLFSQKCIELRPSWVHIALDSAAKLNKTGKITLRLPTTRSAAKRSKAFWKRRFAEISYNLKIRGQIQSSALGLVELIYLGAAYRWPHRHMKFISRLGGLSENSPHLQVMLMPSSAMERVKRLLPSIMDVRWSWRVSNINLYDDKVNKWQVPIERIIDSLDKKSSIRALRSYFGSETSSESHMISKEEAKVADLVTEGIELFYFEIPEFLSNWKLSETSVREIMTNLVNTKVMQISYDITDPSLVSLAIVIQGRTEGVTSLVSSFLKNTPTSFVRMNEKGDNSVILSRLPEDSAYSIASLLPSHGLDYELNIRCMRPTSFRRYTLNLYQRLLRDDGTWDDDVTAFLSQARSKKKELSESNA